MERFTCPECGRPSPHRTDAGIGYCPHCGEFTGLCGAGRRVWLTAGLVTYTGDADWSHSCPRPGVARWQVTVPGGRVIDTLLCVPHGLALMRMVPHGWIRAQHISETPPPPPAAASCGPSGRTPSWTVPVARACNRIPAGT